MLLYLFLYIHAYHRDQLSFPTRRSSDLFTNSSIVVEHAVRGTPAAAATSASRVHVPVAVGKPPTDNSDSLSKTTCTRSEEHTSELQSQSNLVCRLLLEKKKKK